MAIALVALLAIVAAGCGSSDNSSSTEPSSTAESSTASAGGGEGETANAGQTTGVPTLEELASAAEEEEVPSSGPPAVKGASIINISCGEESTGCKAFAQGMAEPAKVIGWKFRVIDGRLNQGDGWAKAIREAVVAKPDAIVINGVNCPEILQPLKEAQAAGIPVLATLAADCNAKIYGTGQKPLFIPFEYTESVKSGEEYYLAAGANQAAYAINATHGEANVITTPYETATGELAAQGWNSEIEKCSSCEVAGEVPWNATTLVGGQFGKELSTALLQYPDANAALVFYDNLGAVVAKSVSDAGRASSMIVAGGEGGAEAQTLIREEKGFSGTAAALDLKQLDWAVIDTINRYLNEEPAVPEALGFGVVDKERLSPPGQGYTSPLNYKAAYEKSWGLK